MWISCTATTRLSILNCRLILDTIPNNTLTQPYIRLRLEEREDSLSPYATKSRLSRGRQVAEESCPMRTEFQRDRDRIIHCKAFRRLKHKTQVFISPLGDHYVTRLTHTLEVAQIARTIARALNLNEDLTEATALGHDMGHTPFGHIGEDELNNLYPGGFKHSQQSLRIVDQLEKEGKGLNLTWEVRQGILRHSKPRGNFMANGLVSEELSLEGQIVRISDAVAYLNHDLADAYRAGVLVETDIPTEVFQVLGRSHSERINAMVSDIVESSWAATGDEAVGSDYKPTISMSTQVQQAVMTLREFMFDNVYIPKDNGKEGNTVRAIVRLLYNHYDRHRDEIPQEYAARSRSEDEAVIDYVSGMTDRYAIRMAEKIEPGIAKIFHERLL